MFKLPLLPTVRCQGCGGRLVEGTGKAIYDAFNSYMLARPPGFNPQSNMDCAIMCTSVASVKLTNDCEGGGSASGSRTTVGVRPMTKCDVQTALQGCLNIPPTETSTGGSPHLTEAWNELTKLLPKNTHGLRAGGPVHSMFSDDLAFFSKCKAGNLIRAKRRLKGAQQKVPTNGKRKHLGGSVACGEGAGPQPNTQPNIRRGANQLHLLLRT
jgi:hypothetical protein